MIIEHKLAPEIINDTTTKLSTSAIPVFGNTFGINIFWIQFFVIVKVNWVFPQFHCTIVTGTNGNGRALHVALAMATELSGCVCVEICSHYAYIYSTYVYMHMG